MSNQTAPMPMFDLAPDHLIQAINPWKLLFRPTGQLGFINVYTMASADSAKEERIITELAGYGRQLGRITDALGVVVSEMGLTKKSLSSSQREAIVDFLEMAQKIAELRGRPAEESILLAMERLAATDPAAHDRVIAKLESRAG